MEYRHPAVPGIAERWGRSVFHCPFCHGWEVRDATLGVLDRGATAVMRASLLRAWSDDVVVFSDGPAGLDDEQAAALEAAGVLVDERPVAHLRGSGETLEAVVFADGSEHRLGGLLAAVTLHQRGPLAAQLGAQYAPPGHLSAEMVQVDARYATSVPGLFAAGDVTPQMQSVANAVMAGAGAAAMIVHDLVVDAPAPLAAGPRGAGG